MAEICLVGGYGTLEELLEAIAWAQLGIHDKPVPHLSSFLQQFITFFAVTTYNVSAILQVGLLNVDGYYDPLLSFIDKAVEEGFIKPTARNIIILAPTPKELIKKLEVGPLPFFSFCGLCPTINSFLESPPKLWLVW
jgi:hypothetical protein